VARALIPGACPSSGAPDVAITSSLIAGLELRRSVRGDVALLERGRVGPDELGRDDFVGVREECAANGTTAFYDNQHSWELTGSTLSFTTVENDCPDRMAETILTRRPWAKQP